MTEENSNIDKVFREKLSNYESKPNPDSWEKISGRLSESDFKQERSWISYAMAAAIILVATVSIFYFVNTEETAPGINENKIVQTNPEVKKETVVKEEPVKSIQKEEPTNITSNPEKKIIKEESSEEVPQMAEISTGENKKEIVLPDGSTVVLNRGGKLTYSSNFKDQREVFLAGEAYFKVKSDSKHPFTIQCAHSKTTVLGTSFILRSYGSESYDEINVIEGRVSFSQKVEKGDEIIIFGGNKGIAQETKIDQTAISDINYNAWLTEKIIFNNTRLKDVFAVLEKYYNVSLTAKNSKILNCEFTGAFEHSDINEILEVLSVSFDLSFDHQSKNYTLSGKGCR